MIPVTFHFFAKINSKPNLGKLYSYASYDVFHYLSVIMSRFNIFCALVCLSIGSSLFFCFYFESYVKNVEHNSQYTREMCLVATNWIINRSCYVLSEPSRFMPSCIGTSCFDRIRQQTSGHCCSDAYRDSKIPTRVIAWGTCDSVFVTFQIVRLNSTFTESVKSCPMDDAYCSQAAVLGHQIGSSHPCWTAAALQATATDPNKPTQGPLTVAIIGLVLMSVGASVLLFHFGQFYRYKDRNQCTCAHKRQC